MVKWRPLCWVVSFVALLPGAALAQELAGSIRGIVLDADFVAPLAAARVQIVETGEEVTTVAQGNYVISGVPPGRYTLIFSKEGYVREIRTDVIVSSGQLTEVNVSLAGEFTEMDEFVVQDILQLGAGSEAALLNLRFESPSLLDSISADFLSRAGASDAASALSLVTGATVQDGKFAVIRGLPDRYVSSQLNGLRLPSADEETRAVELDQFPAAVIESIQVSKTFTPDQQGDASGGAVDVLIKGIPEQPVFQFKAELGVNSQVAGRDDFLTYDGGGVNALGMDDSRDIQYDNIGGNWDGAVGVSEDDAPLNFKWSLAGGTNHVFDNGVKIGGFASLFYERDSAFYDDGESNDLWVRNPGEELTPKTSQGDPKQEDFRTALFDVTQGSQAVQWGGIGTFGVEMENHRLGVNLLYTRTAEDTATLAEDTRGKEYFYPGHDPYDRTTPGHDQPDGAPYLRLETLEYTERTTRSLQFYGQHTLPVGEASLGDAFEFGKLALDWTYANSAADLYQPDKRQFGSAWFPAREPIPGFVIPANHQPFRPAANFNLGNLQRIFKEIEEDSDQYLLNLEWPFEQWGDQPGYLKFGLFDDATDRSFEQETYTNGMDEGADFDGDWRDFWSDVFPDEDHAILESLIDVDYTGDAGITAFYGMTDLPLTSNLNLIGGARFESTEISIVPVGEEEATYFPPGEITDIALTPGAADVDFDQDDLLPSVGLVYAPNAQWTLRGFYAQTVARQTFRELTPVLQQEFLGGPIFVGNPDLGMAALENYDLRVDYAPYAGGLLSLSWFYKDIDDPIEFVQRVANAFTFTTPVNYPEGELHGWEFEIRQELGRFWDPLEGLSAGANATIINSEVTLPDEEAAELADPNIQAPEPTRDATGAPAYLYNIYLAYSSPTSGTDVGLFYTVRGDTLVEGAGVSGREPLRPERLRGRASIQLNFSLISQKLGKYFQACSVPGQEPHQSGASETVLPLQVLPATT